MLLELGGGDLGRGGSWVNCDLCKGADIVHDLDDMPWPFADESIDAVYSSHCIEHVRDSNEFLREVARICREGAEVEIRCPAPFAELAMVCGHVSVVSPQHIRNIITHFPERQWNGERRLELVSHQFQCSEALGEAKAQLPFLRGLSDQVIMRWIPGTAHESVFHFKVVKNEV